MTIVLANLKVRHANPLYSGGYSKARDSRQVRAVCLARNVGANAATHKHSRHSGQSDNPHRSLATLEQVHVRMKEPFTSHPIGLV